MYIINGEEKHKKMKPFYRDSLRDGSAGLRNYKERRVPESNYSDFAGQPSLENGLNIIRLEVIGELSNAHRYVDFINFGRAATNSQSKSQMTHPPWIDYFLGFVLPQHP